MNGYITDTSIFIAAERGERLGNPPEGKGRVSVMTLTELLVGLRAARGVKMQAARQVTVDRARAFVLLPYDEPVAEALAGLHYSALEQKRRAPMADTIIAATALVHDLTVWTRDDDFAVFAELEPRLRIHQSAS